MPEPSLPATALNEAEWAARQVSRLEHGLPREVPAQIYLLMPQKPYGVKALRHVRKYFEPTHA